jgi:FkbM family methyltransferase
MRKSTINLIKSIFRKFDFEIIKLSSLQRLQEKLEENQVDSFDLSFLMSLPNHDAPLLLQNIKNSKSQIRQDLFVLSELGFKKNGFFVEFGATNGLDFSNTYLLEKIYNWRGILAEPAKCWHSTIIKNRSAYIENKCVWSSSNLILPFNEVSMPGLSTINLYSNEDLHSETRKNGKIYNVETISLNDLLLKYNAPPNIDYLSIDTEGSEFDILSNFDFDKYTFKVITCEHNYTPMRKRIFDLLTKNGYIRKFEALSKFDDWYVKVK